MAMYTHLFDIILFKKAFEYFLEQVSYFIYISPYLSILNVIRASQPYVCVVCVCVCAHVWVCMCVCARGMYVRI